MTPGAHVYERSKYPDGMFCIYCGGDSADDGECAVTLRMALDAVTKERDNERERCRAVARGCLDYLGDYSNDAELEVFHHGVHAVINALSDDPTFMRVRVLEHIGKQEEGGHRTFIAVNGCDFVDGRERPCALPFGHDGSHRYLGPTSTPIDHLAHAKIELLHAVIQELLDDWPERRAILDDAMAAAKATK